MPLRRHPALQDLSRDHHLFLVEARNVRWLLDGHERAGTLQNTIEGLLAFWRTHGQPHLREEDEVLFPYCQQYAPKLCEVLELERHFANDHAWLRAKIAELEAVPQLENTTPLLRNMSQFIEAHIRHEERVVFEQIQIALSDEHLHKLHLQSLAFRAEHRTQSDAGPLPADSSPAEA